MKGLTIGAPLVFRGVKVGTVVDIQASVDNDDLNVDNRIAPIATGVEATLGDARKLFNNGD